MFCYAACLLKWFKTEQQRTELLAQLLEAQKQHVSGAKSVHNNGEDKNEAEVKENIEVGDDREEEEERSGFPRVSISDQEVRSGEKETYVSAYDEEEEEGEEIMEEDEEEEEEGEEGEEFTEESRKLTPMVRSNDAQ